MAGIAKLRLGNLQQARLSLRFMDAMATRATYAGLSVGRALEVGVRRSVATQTRLIDFLRRQLADLLNLGYVAAGLNVSLPAAVAALTRRALAAMRQGQFGMRIRAELLGYISVAGCADIRPNKVGGVSSVRPGSHRRLLLATL